MTGVAKKRIKRAAAWTMSALAVVIAVGITVTVGWRPVLGARSRSLTDRRFEATPQRLERGKYLVSGVLNCFDCHSQLPAEELKAGVAPAFRNLGAGRVVIDQKELFVVAPNITSDVETGAGSWTDDQFARAIREGIGHDGRTLFPMMPYQNFKVLSDEDLASVIVFIRSLPPVRNELPKRRIPFPLSRLINSAPEPVTDTVAGEYRDQVARGQYLAKLASCAMCHTPADKTGAPLPGMDFAGGVNVDGFPTASANITPDASGIGYYDEALFLSVMRTGHVGARALNFPMPWWNFRNMTDDDLKAVFAFLRTVKPVHHRVDNTEAATPCKLCRGKHGFGAENGGI